MPDLTTSIASNQSRTDDQMPSTGLTFVAPASEELGGEINVAVLVNGIGHGSDDSPSLAIEAIRQSFHSMPTTDAFQAIADAFKRANDAIRARQSGQTDQQRTGASATIALIAADRLFVGNVGDNRVYLFRENETETLAADQSWVQEAVQSWHVKPGELQDRSAAAAPQQYLGKQDSVTPRFAPIEFHWPGDVLLLCTAALVNRMRDDELRDIATAGNPGVATRQHVHAAINSG
jgi:serine/threonine protein phosphatase PrpC